MGKMIGSISVMIGLLVVSLSSVGFCAGVSVNFDEGVDSKAILVAAKTQGSSTLPTVAEPKVSAQNLSERISPRYGKASISDILLSEKALNDYLTGLSVVDGALAPRIPQLIANASYEEKVKFLAANLKGRLSIEVSGVTLTMLADGTLTGKLGNPTRSCAGPTECVHWITHQICVEIPFIDMGGSTLNCYPDTECDRWGDGNCGE